jgi:hypothetical protein
MKYICPLILPTDERLECGDEEPITWVWRWKTTIETIIRSEETIVVYKFTPAFLELIVLNYRPN